MWRVEYAPYNSVNVFFRKRLARFFEQHLKRVEGVTFCFVIDEYHIRLIFSAAFEKEEMIENVTNCLTEIFAGGEFFNSSLNRFR